MPHPYLQPLSAGEIVRNALRVYRDHLRLLVLVALFPHLALLLLETLAMGTGVMSGGEFVVMLAGTVVVNGVILTGVTVAIGWTLSGEEPSLLEVYSRTFRGPLLAVVAAYLIAAVMISAGMMALFVPGILIGAFFAPSIPMIVVERLGPVEGLARSVSIMKGEWVKGAVVFSFFIAISGFLPLFVLLADSSLSMGPFTPLLGAVVGAVTLPLGFAANVLLYFSLRSTDAAAAAQFEAELRARVAE